METRQRVTKNVQGAATKGLKVGAKLSGFWGAIAGWIFEKVWKNTVSVFLLKIFRGVEEQVDITEGAAKSRKTIEIDNKKNIDESVKEDMLKKSINDLYSDKRGRPSE